MIVPEKTLAKWVALRSPEDTNKIADKVEVSKVTIQAVFRDGKANDEVFKAMAEYYNEKAELLKQYL